MKYDREGIAIKCPKCKHKWTYTGDNPFYITCSRCLSKFKTPKEVLENQEKEKQTEAKQDVTNARESSNN